MTDPKAQDPRALAAECAFCAAGRPKRINMHSDPFGLFAWPCSSPGTVALTVALVRALDDKDAIEAKGVAMLREADGMLARRTDERDAAIARAERAETERDEARAERDAATESHASEYAHWAEVTRCPPGVTLADHLAGLCARAEQAEADVRTLAKKVAASAAPRTHAETDAVNRALRGRG